MLLQCIGDAGATELANALRENTASQILNLKRCLISESGARAVAEMLRSNAQLKSVKLNESIGDAGAEALGNSVQDKQTLETLEMSDGSIGALGAQALWEVFKKGSFMKVCNLGPSKTFLMLALSLEAKEDLNLEEQHRPSGTRALAEMPKTNTSFKSVKLNQNEIRDAGAEALAESLAGEPTWWIAASVCLVPGHWGMRSKAARR